MKKELQIHTSSQNLNVGKTIKASLLAVLFILSTAFFNQAKAQYCLAATSNVTIFPSGTNQTTATYTAGQVAAFNFSASAGCIFHFSTCGLSTDDTYLRIYSTGTGGVVLATADDQCGAQSDLFWTAPSNGVYSILLCDWSCSALSGNTSMTYSVYCPPPCAGCACTGYGSSTASFTGDEEILNVAFGTLSNPSNCGTTAPGPGSSNQLYSNYAGSLAAPNFCQSQAVTFTCNIGTCGGWYGMGLNVYVDFNQNQLFTDAGELVYANASAIQGDNVGTFTVAANALAGTTRIRFVAVEGSVPGPTGTYNWGETEDYCINFPAPPITATSGSICPGQPYVITPSGALTYTYASTGGTLTGTSVTVSPIANTIYTISATAANGCKANGAFTQTVSVSALQSPTLTVVATPTAYCVGGSSSLSVSGANTYTWSGGPNTAGYNVSPIVTTIYTVSGTGTTICNGVKTITVTVNPLPTITVNSGTICSGQPYVLIPSGAFTYSYTGGSATVVTTSTVSPSVVSNYSVTGTSAFGCISAAAAVSSETVFALPVISVNSGAICNGDQFVFLPTGPASNYTFVGTSNPVSPTVTTTYSVIGTSSIGCVSLPAISNVTVNALPVITVASSGSVVCAGTPVNMTASGATTYTWNGSTTGSTLASTPSITTSYLVIGTDANGCTGFANSQVTVNPLPALTLAATNTFICLGNSATLTTSGALTYTWTTGSNTTNVVVTPTANASYGVTGTNTFGCVKTSTVAITVNSIVVTVSSNNAVISNSTAVCDGNTTDLSAAGANTYTWVNNNSHFASINITPSALTVYTVNSIDSKNCKHTNIITVAVNPNPVVIGVASRSVICTGETATLTASGAATYSWLPNGSGSSVVVNGVIAGNLTYVVTGYDNNGCSNDSTIVVNVSKCTGIASIANSGSGVKVYPNPNAGEFTVELENGLNKSIEVTDLTGRVILVSTTKEDKATINISTFAKGVYYVKVQSNNTVEVIKVIKQ